MSDCGISVVFGAGNSSQLVDLYYPAALGLYSDKIITVGSINADNIIAYHNFGDDVNNKKIVWAPGEYVYSAFHDSSPTTYATTPPVTKSYNDMYPLGGTSFATPQVSATISLMLSRNPLLNPKQIKDILLSTSIAGGQKALPNQCMTSPTAIGGTSIPITGTAIRPAFTCPTPLPDLPRTSITQPVYGLNAKLAVEEAIRQRNTLILGVSNNPVDFLAKNLPTVYFDRDKNKVFYADGTEEAYVPSISDFESNPLKNQLVNFKGWKPWNYTTGKEEFEVQTVIGVETRLPFVNKRVFSLDLRKFELEGQFLFAMPNKPKMRLKSKATTTEYVFNYATQNTSTSNKEGTSVIFNLKRPRDLFEKDVVTPADLTFDKADDLIKTENSAESESFYNKPSILPDDFDVLFEGKNGISKVNSGLLPIHLEPKFAESNFTDDGNYTYSLNIKTNLDLDYVRKPRVYFKAFGPDFDHSEVIPENCTGTQCKSPADEFYIDNLDLKYSTNSDNISVTGSTGGSLYKSGDPRGFKYNRATDTNTSGSNYYKLCISGENLQKKDLAGNKIDFCSDIGFTIKQPFGLKNITDSNGDNISIATGESATPVKIGDKIAIPLSRTLINNLVDTNVTIAGQELNFLTLVRNFAVFKIPDELKNNAEFAKAVKDNIVSILLKNKITGKTILTLEQAIAVILEETQINVNFNRLLYFNSGAGPASHCDVIDPVDGSIKGYLPGTFQAIWNKTKTQIASHDTYNSLGVSIYSLDPTGQTFLTNSMVIPNMYPGGAMKWSPKGDKIAYRNFLVGGGIWVVDLNTKIQTLINSNSDNTSFNWSNDGNKIVFSSAKTGRFEIYTMNSDGSDVFQVTNNTGFVYSTVPIFTKDGSRILYVRNTTSYPSGDIYSIKIDGTDNKNITNIENTTPVLFTLNSYYTFEDNYLKLSSDGTKVAFLVAGSIGRNLATMNIDGTDYRQITSLSGPHPRVFTWSTIENKLAYGTTTDTQNTYYWTSSIYTINADGSNNNLLKTDSAYVTPEWGIKSANNSTDSFVKSLSF